MWLESTFQVGQGFAKQDHTKSWGIGPFKFLLTQSGTPYALKLTHSDMHDTTLLRSMNAMFQSSPQHHLGFELAEACSVSNLTCWLLNIELGLSIVIRQKNQQVCVMRTSGVRDGVF